MHVVVVPYDPQWPMLYDKEAKTIRAILADSLVAIYHIGSTAVPGLCAKPIIDIMPVVRQIDTVDLHNQAFAQLGYEVMGEFGIPGRRYLRKGNPERTHQIHIFALPSTHDIRRHLAVRDYLRTHPKEAQAYGSLKQTLAQQFPWDIERYCDGKDAFVKRLEQDALRWADPNAYDLNCSYKSHN